MTVLSLWPHMHLRGKALQLRAVYPNGESEVLLGLPHRSEEHTSELQSLRPLVCRLLLEKNSTSSWVSSSQPSSRGSLACTELTFQVASRMSVLFFLMMRPPPRSTLFPYPTLFRSATTTSLRARTPPPRSCVAGYASPWPGPSP